MNDARSYRWDEMPSDSPMALLSRRRVMGERAMISHVRLEQGCTVPKHAHANEQFCCVLRGRLRFGIGEPARSLEVGAGEVLHLPADVEHSAVALEDTEVLDIFSPPSAATGIDVKR